MSAPRLLPVLLDHSVLTGEQHPRPRVGAIGSYGLSFSEASEFSDPDDATLCTVHARIERYLGERPRRGRSWGGVEHGWPRWTSLLHGDGWSAGWTALRPPPDLGAEDVVELRGHLIIDFGALTRGRVCGMTRRLWTVHSRRDVPVDPERHETWPPAWGCTVLTPVDEMPMAGSGQPRPALIPDLDYTGLLAELDVTTTEPERRPSSSGRDGATPEDDAGGRR